MTEPGPKLSLRVQAGYATADVGMNAAEVALRFYLFAFYTDVVGLSAHLTGLATALALLWDGVIDPVMGLISDRTYRRFGTRRVWLPIGGVILAIGLGFVFWPPELDGDARKFVWLLASYCVLNTGFAVLYVPFAAMAGEMTADPYQRSVLFGWRFAMSNFGGLVAAALPFVFLVDGAAITHTLPAVSLVVGALVLATTLVSYHATARVRFLVPDLTRETLRAAFTAPFRNRAFRPLVAAYVIAYTGVGVNAVTFLHYYRHVLHLSEHQTQTVFAVFVVVFTVSLPGWVRLAKFRGKLRPLIIGATVLAIGNTALYVCAPVGGFPWVLAFGAIGLASFAGCVVLIDSMVTDVIDHDLLRTGRVRGGLFFGVWRFATKLARALSVVVVAQVLGAAGFVEKSDTQPPAVAHALTWLFGPGVGVLFLATALLLWRYRFDDGRHAKVRALLARRTARRARGRAAGSTERSGSA